MKKNRNHWKYLFSKILILKNKVEEEIEKVKYNINNNINSCTIWKWKDITLVDLIKGELDFLKKNFIITNEMPIDKNSFINNNFIHPLNCEAYPFSLKELYYMLLYRGIFVSINNYYYLNNNNKWILKKDLLCKNICKKIIFFIFNF